jgi:hypothetical protein
MKHILAVIASVVFGACVAAIAAIVAYPHVSEFSYAPPIIVFPALSMWVSLPAYIVAMTLSSVRAKKLGRKMHPAWGVAVSTGATLIASIATVAFISIKDAKLRADGEKRWSEMQALQRRNPHALVNDATLPNGADSGYRIMFVDSKRVVRVNDELINPASYVVLPPGKHFLALHGDEKTRRSGQETFLQGSVEVEAGRFYQLQVTNGIIWLIEVSQSKEPN